MEQGGVRLRNTIKNSTASMPLLSIITVVRNCEEFIEQTIESIVNQSCANIEYIVIDGDSSDRTLEIIKANEDKIDYWISEPDKGIYDAMNKGIGFATGEWINFMNAGDEFFNFNVCKFISDELLISKHDVIYGDFVSQNEDYHSLILVKAKPLSLIWKGMIFSHQSCFCKLELLQNQLFNTKYKIAADYNLFLELFLSNKSFYYLPIPISKGLSGGISYSNINTYIEEIKIIHSQKPYTIKLIYFVIPLIISLCRRIFGSRMTKFIRKIKWKIRGIDVI